MVGTKRGDMARKRGELNHDWVVAPGTMSIRPCQHLPGKGLAWSC
jgi:hypothetical protein